MKMMDLTTHPGAAIMLDPSKPGRSIAIKSLKFFAMAILLTIIAFAVFIWATSLAIVITAVFHPEILD